MIYLQDSFEKDIFSNFLDCNTPLDWCGKVKIDTEAARVETLDLMDKCKRILELLDKVEKDAE